MVALVVVSAIGVVAAGYTNFESSHVHPIDLTPSGARLLVVNTPDAMLEVFTVQADGSLTAEASIPVGLEPVTVVARTDLEAWVVNSLSDTISIVDLDLGVTVKTLAVGNEPTDVAFTGGKAFVAVSEEDAVKVFNLSDLNAAPATVSLLGRDVRALAVSNSGTEVYAVVLKSGNQTTFVNANIAHFNNDNADLNRLNAMGLRDLTCAPTLPAYPPLPAGVTRNTNLIDPLDGVPKVGLIVRWNETSGAWEDDAGTSWNNCISYRLADHDLFIIDATTLGATEVDHLGTSLFEVSVNPGNGKIYVPNTDARNQVRFEPRVMGHVVSNGLAIVDPAAGNAVDHIYLNSHIDRLSDPASNLSERLASVSQPGMLVWDGTGSFGYLTAIGSRKVFRVNGSCTAGDCIFTDPAAPDGPDRSSPDAVEVGEGPTGVALLGAPINRLYVLNRISHSISVVDTTTLGVTEEIPLHDPSSQATREGRRFLYDAIDGSGHGDASCASCHLSGDQDGLAWDLGDPGGDLVPYATPMDNVRFITLGGVDCDPLSDPGCSTHQGFDPQKGPTTTQTLRGMLEPLHWRGDRGTMNDFNAAFVGLMGTADIGPINGKPAGLTAADMEKFRQFALEIRFPPNPHRLVDDTLPCGPRGSPTDCEVQPHGSILPGNPGEGEDIFDTGMTDGGGPCVACHTRPFGAGGGTLGGVTPQEPTSMNAAALFNGVGDQSLHSDLKVPHLRNMYEKFGPVLAAPGDGSMPTTINGFGYGHDGSIPDLFRFFSINVFTLSSLIQAQQVRDVATFMLYFPTGTKPAVGRSVTVPAGTPPTGPGGDETLLATLASLGDLTDPSRHCELVATAPMDGRIRAWHLSGGAWVGDLAAEGAKSTTGLREAAAGPLSFVCTPLGSGQRLGGDRDEDSFLNGDDCAPGDPASWTEPLEVTNLSLNGGSLTPLSWDDQAPTIGPSVRYDLVGGLLSDLGSRGLASATSCIESAIVGPSYTDLRPDPPSGDGYYYLLRGRNPCSAAGFGPSREALDSLACPSG
jgi:YVTN family beta-propeller protein